MPHKAKMMKLHFTKDAWYTWFASKPDPSDYEGDPTVEVPAALAKAYLETQETHAQARRALGDWMRANHPRLWEDL